MKKKIAIASATVLTLAVATMAVPSVYAQTTETVKRIGRGFMERGAGFHRGGFDNAKFLEEHAVMLGITADDLKARLESGKTIRDIASDLGISEETLQAKMQEQRTARQAEMKATMTARLAQDVADGKITQEQADNMLERLQNPNANKHGFGFGGGFEGMGHHGGPRPSGAPGAVDAQ